jgi:hypothetical protein
MLDRRRRRLAVHQRGELTSQTALRRALMGPFVGHLLQFGELLGPHEGEPPQVVDDVAVAGVDEVLVPGIRAGHLRVEP